ncbi:spinster family MFS transporter [Nitrospirillum iridis]|uniref:MFS family permease n=1 Tax=Nitrospirillum iridis TaxID=765888 RepID=A0A7X0AZW7_9PROT|nr:MFS transporter [Nitrospirillum iridis]MBB6253207.1 MFS family permease [Nitrospirillum iridis]
MTADPRSESRSVQAAPAGEYPAPGYAWYVVLVLLIVGVTSYLDRYLISLLVEPIKAELAITDTQISLLQGTAFALFYVAFGLPFGAVVDRANRRAILAVGIALWSVMTFACGLATSYWQLFVARAGVGIGEACLAPAAYSLIADYFPPQRRGRAMSTYNMSNYLGVGASLLLGGMVLRFLGDAPQVAMPGLGPTSTWKAVFFLVGLPGLLLALLMATVREESRKGAQGEAKPTFQQFFTHLRSFKGAYTAVYFVSALTAFVGLTFAAWGASFFIRTYGMKPAQVGLTLGPVNAVAGVLGCLASGYLSDRLVASGRPGGRFLIPLIWWPIALVGLLALAVAPGKEAALMAVALLTFGSGLGLASVPPTIQDITPNRLRGRATALHFIFSGLLGMGVAPTLIALVTDHVLRDPHALSGSLLIVLCPVIVAGFIACLAGQRVYERARHPQ